MDDLRTKKTLARGARRIGFPPSLKKHPSAPIAFVDDDETSDDGEEAMEKTQRERKKATEQSLCQICKGSQNPELVKFTLWEWMCNSSILI